MNISYLVIFLVFLSATVLAQEDRTSNSDLRGNKLLFSLDLHKNKVKGYELARSISGDHSFHTKYSDKVVVKKIDSTDAHTLDEKIAAEFINLKYFMGPLEKCSSFHFLRMRDEELKVCLSDKKRKAKINELVKIIQHKI